MLRRRGARAQETRRYLHTPPHSYRAYATDRFLPGVKSYDVSLDSQTAKIVTDPSVDYSTVLEKIKKTGKTVNSGEADGVAQPV